MTSDSYAPETIHTLLGTDFFDEVVAADFPETRLRYRNDRAAASVGLEALTDEAWLAHFGRFEPLTENLERPLALRYHGHQFRQYNRDIGDGRGFLFAQLRDKQGRLLDLGTKGTGQTPYSRAGDGRLTLKGGIREILATEMLEALGVSTSKTLSIIETGEALQRNDEPSPTRSAVMVRLNHSHIRFGSFQFQAYHSRSDNLMKLVDHAVTHYFPHLAALEGEMRVLGFFGEVITRSANLVAQWVSSGFVHGVLNTDNMNITGESFDYGPWRFAPVVDPSFTAAYFDQTGLYAYARQPEAVAWNLAQLGGCLVPLIEDEEVLNAALQTYAPAYEKAMEDNFARRFGVENLPTSFLAQFMDWMNQTGAPLEQVFFDWFCGKASDRRAAQSPIAELYQKESFQELKRVIYDAKPVQPERIVHPYFEQKKPCTMLIDEVEAIWAPIADEDDWSAFDAKILAIKQMREAYVF